MADNAETRTKGAVKGMSHGSMAGGHYDPGTGSRKIMTDR